MSDENEMQLAFLAQQGLQHGLRLRTLENALQQEHADSIRKAEHLVVILDKLKLIMVDVQKRLDAIEKQLVRENHAI